MNSGAVKKSCAHPSIPERNVSKRNLQMDEQSLTAYQAATIEALASMSESVLQAKIIEPLLRLMGFTHVRDVSGSNDRGKDLVAIKLDFGKPKLYAIQIKRLKLTGKYTNTRSMTNVVMQLRQTMLEPVLDPLVNIERPPDRGIFITPYEIHRDALASAIQQVRELERREITIIDGPLLVDQVLHFMPEAVTELDIELRYRMQLAKSADRIVESSAFDLRKDLSLDDIYVDLSMMYVWAALMTRKSRESGPKIVPVTISELKMLRNCFDKWTRRQPRIWDPPQKKLSTKRREELLDVHGRRKSLRLVEIDLDPLIDSIRSKVSAYMTELPKLAKALPEGELNRIAKKGILLSKQLGILTNLTVIREYWPVLVRPTRADTIDLTTPLIPSSSLEKIQYPVFITGEPGSGKTTLLRRLSQNVARSSRTALPILVYLVRIKEATENALIEECRFELAKFGYRISKLDFLAGVDSGKYQLFLDGLDEVGSLAGHLFKIIQRFTSKHKKCVIMVSCRDTLSLGTWPDALHLNLNRFTNTQLNTFIDNWFSAEPSGRATLKTWLNNNPRMKKSARTPVIAALLCSLHHAEADMPSTEVDLYEGRFALLLGKWERAKGIQPLSPRLRNQYWHFIMAMAMYMHQRETRMIDYDSVIKLGREYYTRDFHHTGESMILDCVHRGLLLREITGHMSFGHLTYQEFLVGRWLAHHNPVAFIWGKILTPWWKKALEFYSLIQGDITQLVIEGLKYRGESASFEMISSHLARLAPLTSQEYLRKFKCLPRTEILPRFQWEKTSTHCCPNVEF